jgi:hypothetical protein
MIVSYNFYYARPGDAAAVLQQRIRASDVRAQLGLPRGRIISKVEGEGDWPDVIWRLDFADMAAQYADMKARAESPEFETIRHGMRQLYRRFERPLYAPFNKDTSPPNDGAQQSIVLYGVYCDAAASTKARAVLDNFPAVELMSGGTDIPRILCETGSAGLPQAVLENLRQLPAQVERSIWRIEDHA